MTIHVTAICEGCPYYEREQRTASSEAAAGPIRIVWYTHKCWHGTTPVTRLGDTRQAIVRACAHKPLGGRRRKRGEDPR